MILILFVFGVWGLYLNAVEDYGNFMKLPREKRVATYTKLTKWIIVLSILCLFGSCYHRNSVTGDWYNSKGEKVF